MPSTTETFRFASHATAGTEVIPDGNLAYEADCGSNCGYYAHVDNVLVKPYFTHNVAFNILDNGITEVPFDWDLEYSSRVEIGYANGCGLGWRARYWYLDNSTTLVADANNIFIGFGDDHAEFDNIAGIIRATHGVELDVVDLELTYEDGCWVYSAGLRYARMDQSYDAIINGNDLIFARHNFEGLGPTMAATRHICCFGSLSVFANLRGSLLFGSSALSATDEDFQDFTLRRNEGDLVGIGEMQLGVDWRRQTCNGVLFVATGLEAQYWVNGGTAAPSTVEDDDPSYQDEGAQSADMGFFGGFLRIGFLR